MGGVLVRGCGGSFLFVACAAIARLLVFRCGMRFLHQFFRSADQEQIEQSHAHGDSVGDLLEDTRLRAVGDFGSDFDAAIHRAGMKNDGIWLGEAESFCAELIKKNVVRGGKSRLVKALGLHAQNENDVSVFESFFDAEDASNGSAWRANAFEFAGNPHRRAAEREAAAKFREQVNVRAGHAAVRNVAEDGYV